MTFLGAFLPITASDSSVDVAALSMGTDPARCLRVQSGPSSPVLSSALPQMHPKCVWDRVQPRRLALLSPFFPSGSATSPPLRSLQPGQRLAAP